MKNMPLLNTLVRRILHNSKHNIRNFSKHKVKESCNANHYIYENTIDDSMVHIISATHVSPHSFKDIQQVSEQVNPDCFALEMCLNRAQSSVLLEGSNPEHRKIFSYYSCITNSERTQSLVNYEMSQSSLSSFCGSNAAAENFAALTEASKRSADVFLIDKPFEAEMLHGLETQSTQTNWSRLTEDIIESILPARWHNFVGDPSQGSDTEILMTQLTKHVDSVDANHLQSGDLWQSADILQGRDLAMQVVKSINNDVKQKDPKDTAADYSPEFIEERDICMANNINILSKKYKNILVVVGALHVNGILDILERNEHKSEENHVVPKYEPDTKAIKEFQQKHQRVGINVNIVTDRTEYLLTKQQESQHNKEDRQAYVDDYSRILRQRFQYAHYDYINGIVKGYAVEINESDIASTAEKKFGYSMQKIQEKQHEAQEIVQQINHFISLGYSMQKNLKIVKQSLKALRRKTEQQQRLLLKIRPDLIHHPVLRVQLDYQLEQPKVQLELLEAFEMRAGLDKKKKKPIDKKKKDLKLQNQDTQIAKPKKTKKKQKKKKKKKKKNK